MRFEILSASAEVKLHATQDHPIVATVGVVAGVTGDGESRGCPSGVRGINIASESLSAGAKPAALNSIFSRRMRLQRCNGRRGRSAVVARDGANNSVQVAGSIPAGSTIRWPAGFNLHRSLTAEMTGCRPRANSYAAAAPKYPSNVSRCSTFPTPESARLSFPVRQSVSLARSSHGALWPDVRWVGTTFAMMASRPYYSGSAHPSWQPAPVFAGGGVI